MCPPAGYGEHVLDLLVLRHPGAALKAYHPGEERLTLEAALAGLAPVIGKAPDFLHLGFGHTDVLVGRSPGEVLQGFEVLLQTLLMKTQARITLANLCEAFLPEAMRVAARECNVALKALEGDRVQVLDLNLPVLQFLDRHRRGGGEKRSLHENALRLTSLGRTLLARTVFEQAEIAGMFPD